MKDIETIDDCGTLVQAFYRTARADALLGPVFESRIAGRWDEHLERMTRFWGTVLLALQLYDGKPVDRHVGLPIGPGHFGRWVSLWSAEVDQHFAGPRADLAKRAAQKMALRMGSAAVGLGRAAVA